MGLQLSSLDRDFTTQFGYQRNPFSVSSVQINFCVRLPLVAGFGSIRLPFAPKFGSRSVHFRLNVYSSLVPKEVDKFWYGSGKKREFGVNPGGKR